LAVSVIEISWRARSTYAAARCRIEADFPGWGVWQSDTGRWWAFRTAADPLTIDQLRAGRRLIVHAETVDALHTAIRDEVTI
jgi:hypothetical protein